LATLIAGMKCTAMFVYVLSNTRQSPFEIAVKKLLWEGRRKWVYTILLEICNRGRRFLSYNFLQSAIDGKNNSKTKVEKAFFFIFMSSFAEMRF
jgi:hypothetical protein